MQNMLLLGQGQWQSLIDKKNYVFNLTKLWEEENNDVFHAYRKLLRYASDFITDPSKGFPQLVHANITIPLTLFSQLGHNMGVIHDAIVAYYFYNSTGNFEMARQMIIRIETLWPIEQKWTLQVDLLGMLAAVRDALGAS